MVLEPAWVQCFSVTKPWKYIYIWFKTLCYPKEKKKKIVMTSFLRYDIIEKPLKFGGRDMHNTACSPLQNNHRLYLKGTDS